VAANATLPLPAPVALDDAHVNVDGGSDDVGCAGTATNPTAPNGFVCIYPYYTENLTAATLTGWIWGTTGDGVVKWGFQVGWNGTGAANSPTVMFGTWAYTAP
jgi:hypothetical protein